MWTSKGATSSWSARTPSTCSGGFASVANRTTSRSPRCSSRRFGSPTGQRCFGVELAIATTKSARISGVDRSNALATWGARALIGSERPSTQFHWRLAGSRSSRRPSCSRFRTTLPTSGVSSPTRIDRCWGANVPKSTPISASVTCCRPGSLGTSLARVPRYKSSTARTWTIGSSARSTQSFASTKRCLRSFKHDCATATTGRRPRSSTRATQTTTPSRTRTSPPTPS